MSTGQIRWDDENTNNQTKYVQPLPYVDTYKGNLRLSFCCANNGDRSVPIKLPGSRPFYLLPYKSSKCQQVEWMVATMEWIKYDKENTGTDYSERTGSVPYNTLNKEKDITMYYCYYKSKYQVVVIHFSILVFLLLLSFLLFFLIFFLHVFPVIIVYSHFFCFPSFFPSCFSS